MSKKPVLLMIMFFLGGCSYNAFLDNYTDRFFSNDNSFSNLPNFRQVNNSIYAGGRPSMEGIKQLQEKGIKTVLSLRSDDNLSFVERHLAKQYGLEFVNIAISTDKKPTQEQVSEFLKTVTDENKKPVYVHCGDGTEQTTTMFAVYRVFVERWSPEKAFAEIKEFGFPSELPRGELKKFIYGMKKD